MSQQPKSDREAELDALRQRLCELESRCRDLEGRAPRSLRPRWSRKFLLGALPAVLLVSGGLLYAEGDALFIDEKGVGIEKNLDVKGDAAFGGKVGIGTELNVKENATFGGKVGIGKAGTNDVYLTVQGRMLLPDADAGVWFGSSTNKSGLGRYGPHIGFNTPSAISGNYWPLQISTETGHVGIGTTPDDKAKLKVAGQLSVTEAVAGTATIKGLLEAKQYKPAYDSNWRKDDAHRDHRTAFEHKLGYIPTQITLYFSPDWRRGKAYPVRLSRYENIRGNPVTTEVTETHIVLSISSGSNLGEVFDGTWKTYKEGYWRVVLF